MSQRLMHSVTSTSTRMILEQTVNLTGITAGGGETQVLSITAVE